MFVCKHKRVAAESTRTARAARASLPRAPRSGIVRWVRRRAATQRFSLCNDESGRLRAGARGPQLYCGVEWHGVMMALVTPFDTTPDSMTTADPLNRRVTT